MLPTTYVLHTTYYQCMYLVAAELDGEEGGGGDEELAELPPPVVITDHHVLQPAHTAATVDELPLPDQGGGPHHPGHAPVLHHDDVVGGVAVHHLVPTSLPLLPGDVPHAGQLGEESEVALVIILQAQRPHHQASTWLSQAQWRIKPGLVYTGGQVEVREDRGGEHLSPGVPANLDEAGPAIYHHRSRSRHL